MYALIIEQDYFYDLEKRKAVLINELTWDAVVDALCKVIDKYRIYETHKRFSLEDDEEDKWRITYTNGDKIGFFFDSVEWKEFSFHLYETI